MSSKPTIISVALKTPLMTLFDYLPPADSKRAAIPGTRVRVPFGRGHRIGVVVATGQTSTIERDRLRQISEVLDRKPVLDAQLLSLLSWAGDYYCHAPGEVVAAALPRLLRTGRAGDATEAAWSLTGQGARIDRAALASRAPRQAQVLGVVADHPDGAGAGTLSAAMGTSWRAVVRRLETRGWLKRHDRKLAAPVIAGQGQPAAFDLSDDQRNAVEAVCERAQTFGVFLLHGVTGSGKTEVYLRLISQTLAAGKQALVLVPEIGLTPQLVERFRRRLDAAFVAMHSGLSDNERLFAWRAAHDGSAAVVIGTRSAIFAPLANPGLIIVDEEHDASYKQQDGFRYSARDLAVMRSRQLGIPVVLGSATPSLESLHNADRGRYRKLDLHGRPGSGAMPPMRLIDMRSEPSDNGLSLSLRTAMRRHLDEGGQVLLFLNRRGFAPGWYCPGCGWIAACRRCDARMTLHHAAGRLRCHHCGASRVPEPACPTCESEPAAVGQGTERIEQALKRAFAEVSVARIDRDSTRRRGTLENLIGEIRAGKHRILVGTQMLTKGHHFPDVTLVGIVDADQGLFGTDPRSNERLAQLVIQVAGRAGRADKPGEVLIQTHCPAHPLLNVLLSEGYERFASAALAEREAAGWPPFAALAMLRAEALSEAAPMQFLQAARELADPAAAVRILGPAAAPMARRAGRYRAQLLLQGERRDLQRFLREWTPQLGTIAQARQTRWSIDVDPLDLF